MQNLTDYFEGRGTQKLFYQYWGPDSDKIKAIIIAFHGLGTHSDRLKLPAEYFAEKGYGIYAFDLRGHWRNIIDIPGHIDSMEDIQKDIFLFMDMIKKKNKDKKVFTIGQSLGGLIALIYAIDHPAIAGVIASSPLLGIKMNISSAKKIDKIISGQMKTIELEIEQNKMTSDVKILRKHIADKNRLTQITIKSYSEIEDAMKLALKNAARLICPVLINQGSEDKFSDIDKTKKFFKNIRSSDKTYKEYNGFVHELWHEKRRAEVYRDMFVWIGKHL
ncbi:MAG: lysophospholipase [Candidatus Lokiarchaeota archaeon]|nr:lysophospholipase [Candidatus Lokiarchaeota archaeon]